MPRKKQVKSSGEKIAEDYFPVKEEDVKYSIEKPYKKPERSSLETIAKKGRKKAKTSRRGKKTTRSSSSKTRKDFKPQKINLKEKGYELIITEKPQAASKISAALGKTSTKREPSGISYYEIQRDGKKIIVACAVGHLFTLSQNSRGTDIPTFDISWKPNYMVRKKDFTKKYYDTISKLAKGAGSVTIATDYDIEGEVIGLNVMRYLCGQKDANRMKFSTLTNVELNNAYDNKFKKIDWGQAIAGETRHYLDWFYGINLSRALMNAIKTTGRFKIMSIGRVQGPALHMIVEKEKEIQAFKSQPYWQVFITVKNLAKEIFNRDRNLEKENKKSLHVKNSHELELKHNKDLFNKSELEKFKDLVGRKAQAETKKTEQKLPPQPPFNLTTLQTEAYKFYGLSPSRTLQIAQSLYLSGLISYPRTSSQKLPPSIGYKEILKKLAKQYKVEDLIVKNKPIEGKKSDSAHPSIYPTGEFQILSGQDEKVYNLIVKRFLSLFCEDAIIDNKTIKAIVDGLIFSTRGSSIRKKAWMAIYPSKLKEKEIPDLEGEVDIIDSRIEEKETQPPKRYSQASIISELEKRNLGTKATRASILETLYDRGYIKEQSIEATSLGISLIETLEKHSPIIIDEKLTRNFEKEMDNILESKTDFEVKEKKVIEKAKETITKISEQFEKQEKEVGKELLKANEELREEQKKENTLNVCPICKKGSLAITYSRKTKRHFIACNAYPNCKNTYSLPPNSIIKKTSKNCEKCGFPMLMSLKRGRKPWFFCFNKDCETNKERLEEYRKKQAEENNNS